MHGQGGRTAAGMGSRSLTKHDVRLTTPNRKKVPAWRMEDGSTGKRPIIPSTPHLFFGIPFGQHSCGAILSGIYTSKHTQPTSVLTEVAAYPLCAVESTCYAATTATAASQCIHPSLSAVVAVVGLYSSTRILFRCTFLVHKCSLGP